MKAFKTGSILRNEIFVRYTLSCSIIAFLRRYRVYGGGIDGITSTFDRHLKTDIGEEKRELNMNTDKMNKTAKDGESICDNTKEIPKTFSQEERQILLAHKEAVEADEEMYKDPVTGYHVFTQKTLLKRKECCGNACRHCPYGHVNVPEQFKTKKFNSLFYV